MQEILSQKMTCFLEEGFSHRDFKGMVCQQPSILNLSFDENVRLKLRLLEGKRYPGQSLSMAEVRELVTGAPATLTLSLINISSKLEHLINVLNRDLRELLTSPAYLCYSLEGRIAPRFAYIRSVGGRSYMPLSQVVTTTDQTFCKRLGVDVKDYQAFLSSKTWNVPRR